MFEPPPPHAARAEPGAVPHAASAGTDLLDEWIPACAGMTADVFGWVLCQGHPAFSKPASP